MKFLLATAILLTALIVILSLIAMQQRQRIAPQLSIPSGATLETLSKLWPTVCYYGYWYGGMLYCYVELDRSADGILKARVGLRSLRVKSVRYYTQPLYEGISAYTSCSGY